MRTIAVANQKGGCGKTTTSVNLSAALAQSGKRVLLIDLDPQGHATLGVGFEPEEFEKTIYNAIIDPLTPLESVVVATKFDGLSLAPSNVLLSGAETEITPRYARERLLRQTIEKLNGRYDFCIIDCSPSLSLLTLNALVASSEVIIPVQTHYYALEGLKQLLETIGVVRDRFNYSLRILGILLTFFESRTLLSQEVRRETEEHFGKLVLKTVIHRSIRLAEAPSAGEPILAYDSKSIGAREYMALAQEITAEEAVNEA
jgi:chromosome partitioning protein